MGVLKFLVVVVVLVCGWLLVKLWRETGNDE